MKNLLATTALAALLGASAIAQTATDPVGVPTFEASELIGKRLFTGSPTDAEGGWEDIGEIDDLVVTMDGEVPTVIVGVGGFLGIGEKDVAVPIDMIQTATDSAGEAFLVVDLTAEQLEEMPAYAPMIDAAATTETDMGQTDHLEDTAAALEEDAAALETDVETAAAEGAEAVEQGLDAAGTAVAEGAEAIENAADDVAAAVETEIADAATQRDGLLARDLAELELSQLQGLTVYSADDQNVGEISELILGADGTLERFIVDVGGFLGLGAKPVELSAAELSIMQVQDGDELRAYTQQTEESLEAMPEYEG